MLTLHWGSLGVDVGIPGIPDHVAVWEEGKKSSPGWLRLEEIQLLLFPGAQAELGSLNSILVPLSYLVHKHHSVPCSVV